MLTLAQGFDLSDLQAPPLQVPEPPLLPHLLLESPTVPALALAAIGVALGLIVANRRSRPLGLAILAASGLLAAGLLVLADRVTTDREHLALATRRLVRAVERGDTDALAGLLHPRAIVRTGVGPAFNRDATLAFVATRLATYGIASAPITQLAAALDSRTVARTQVGVRVESTDGPPTPTWWLITWNRLDPAPPGSNPTSADQPRWLAIDIKPIKIAGTDIDP